MPGSVIHISVERLEDGSFFVAGHDEDGILDSLRLKHRLFAWHAKSYYGTLLEETRHLSRNGVLLSPAMAADYLAAPLPSLHSVLQWDEASSVYRRLARLLIDCLCEGRFKPSYKKWQAGGWGWELLPDESQRSELDTVTGLALAAGLGAPDRWLDDILLEWSGTVPAVVGAWEVVSEQHPAVPVQAILKNGDPGQRKRGEETTSLWADEEDWLIGIGWTTDAVPFQTCLRLTEPDYEEGDSWQLNIVLQDKEHPSYVVEYGLFGTAAGEIAEGRRQIAAAAAPEVIDVSGRRRAFESVGTDFPVEAATPRIPERWKDKLDERVAKQMHKWCAIAPWLGEVRSGLLADDEAWRFLEEVSAKLLQAGTVVLLPGWWEEVKRQKPRLKAIMRSSVGSADESFVGLDQLMQFDWKVAVGDQTITEEQFRQLASQNKRLVRLEDRWVQLDPVLLKQIRLTMKRIGRQGLSFRDVLEMHLLDTGEPSFGADHLEDAGAGGTGAGAGDLSPEAELSALFRFEVELNGHLSAMVANLSGSGRLPQWDSPAGFTGTLRGYQLEGSSWLYFLRRFGLGGCLADDMGLGKTIQWIAYLMKVIEKEKPGMPALLICPTSVLGNWQKELERFAPTVNVYVHYGTGRVKGEAFSEYAAGYDLVITSYTLAHLDEAELSGVSWSTLCLDEAQNIKNVYTKQASAIRKLHVGHRIALTGTPIENRLTELWSIFDFVNPGYLGSLPSFTRRYVTPIEKTNDSRLIGQVQKLVRPFLLRRLKSDPAIQLDLPEKNESKAYVHLTAEQAALYEHVVRELFEKIDDLSAMERRGLILASLTRLKQLCNHPAMLLKGKSGDYEPGRSNKLTRLLEMVEELREEGDRCLVFTQFVETGHMLKELLERQLGEQVAFLHGGVSKAGRDKMIASFQSAGSDMAGRRVFILSLKAGGTGLNLTGANHVFHFDRWWNPAVENQATDRAFRIGQTRNVQVHKFVTLGTIEERIDDMIERKQSLNEQIVGGESWITEMSTGELQQLFHLRKEWIDK
ncbi:DEAD/DEAH box helicase [Paenibacillus sp. IB182363]|uniref:DEAD/DEAH box helicase n=2 Tax=Paenibacillus oceani TaxID=2772510 RepID=A0A927CB50_9BACL|nr:DEAD/DEAH box helicase [Paenibacillus oceani]